MRYLVCTNSKIIGVSDKVLVTTASSGTRYRIIEEDFGQTPYGMQLTHVTQGTAEWIAKTYPDDWKIIEEI
jgi:hypothetical protein